MKHLLWLMLPEVAYRETRGMGNRPRLDKPYPRASRIDDTWSSSLRFLSGASVQSNLTTHGERK
jgi:hypothetical protein